VRPAAVGSGVVCLAAATDPPDEGSDVDDDDDDDTNSDEGARPSFAALLAMPHAIRPGQSVTAYERSSAVRLLTPTVDTMRHPPPSLPPPPLQLVPTSPLPTQPPPLPPPPLHLVARTTPATVAAATITMPSDTATSAAPAATATISVGCVMPLPVVEPAIDFIPLSLPPPSPVRTPRPQPSPSPSPPLAETSEDDEDTSGEAAGPGTDDEIDGKSSSTAGDEVKASATSETYLSAAGELGMISHCVPRTLPPLTHRKGTPDYRAAVTLLRRCARLLWRLECRNVLLIRAKVPILRFTPPARMLTFAAPPRPAWMREPFAAKRSSDTEAGYRRHGRGGGSDDGDYATPEEEAIAAASRELSCDINVSSPEGVVSSGILLECIDQAPALVRPFLLLVKAWARQRGVDDAHRAYPGSYSWCVLALAYLMRTRVCHPLPHRRPPALSRDLLSRRLVVEFGLATPPPPPAPTPSPASLDGDATSDTSPSPRPSSSPPAPSAGTAATGMPTLAALLEGFFKDYAQWDYDGALAVSTATADGSQPAPSTMSVSVRAGALSFIPSCHVLKVPPTPLAFSRNALWCAGVAAPEVRPCVCSVLTQGSPRRRSPGDLYGASAASSNGPRRSWERHCRAGWSAAGQATTCSGRRRSTGFTSC